MNSIPTKARFKQLINPHSHSESSLDGASSVDSIIARNKALGATHVCATEHGNLNSAMDLVLGCKKEGIKPILGIELYLMPPWIDAIRAKYLAAYQAGRLKLRSSKPDKVAEEIERKVKNYYFHLTVHFKTYQAYQHFCMASPKMNERAVVKYGEIKALATIDDLIPVRDQITICSSCMGGPIGRTIMGSQDGVIEPNQELAERYYNMLRELVGPDNFFVEIFPHDITHTWIRTTEKKVVTGETKVLDENGKPRFDQNGQPIMTATFKTETIPGHFKPHECTPDLPDGDLQKRVNLYMMQLAAKYGDRVIVSLDSHYAVPEDKIVQDAKLGNGLEAWKFYNSYHVMSSDEAFEKLNKSLGVESRQFEEWVDNSLCFASKFDDFKMPTSKDRWLLQDPPDNFMELLKSKIDSYGRMDWGNQEMIARLQQEIKVIGFNKKKNFINYLFTVEKVADFCRNNDVLINIRGSAGGSLLLYLLGVSAVNPLKHELNFERFITEGRINANTLPDVDIDVSDQAKVFAFLEKEYGDRFCRLSMDTMLHLKSSIKDAERYLYGYVNPATEALTKMLPGTPQGTDDSKFVFGYEEDGVHHPGLIDTNPSLKTYANQNPKIWEMVTRMLGIQRNKSVHPCGIILMADPVQSCIPVIKINGTKATGFSPHAIEAAGGVKYDILGLNTLRDIQLCLRSIKDRLGADIDPWSLPHDDKCYEEFAAGNTETVFQFDTPTVRPYLKKIRPTSIDDLSSITALCRPGTLDAPSGEGDQTLSQLYVERANGRPIRYTHPDLEPILKSTMGISIFQETTLRMFRDLAGMSYEEAESVRRAIGKKDAELLASNFGRLREGCLKRGWKPEQIDLLIEQIKASQSYSFNKSHACLSYDQNVLTVDGPKKIGEIVESKDNTPILYMKSDGTVASESPSDFFYQGMREVWEVELSDGSKVELTPDHKVWYRSQWVELRDALLDGGEFQLSDGAMVTVSGLRPLGVQRVYDISMPTDHNFLLENGLPVHNCSYAYVAYACMYLKTNYPLDWWKATLSNSTRDEISQKFWRHVKDFVDLPTVNNVSDSFQIQGNRLVAPLSILSGVGPKAYLDLTTRAPYQDFQDFVTKHFSRKAEKSALNRPTVYKMLASGILDSLLPPNSCWADKVNAFVTALGVANDTGPEKIDLKYASFSSLGQYLIRKNIISIYSDDLRPIMLPQRGGMKRDRDTWEMRFGTECREIVDGWFIEDLKASAAVRMAPPIRDVRVLGYVLDEKAKQYKNKTKQATQMVVDVNGTFYEEILWPQKDMAKAPSGFKKLPCIFVYSSTTDRVFLKEVVPLIGKDDLDNMAEIT